MNKQELIEYAEQQVADYESKARLFPEAREYAVREYAEGAISGTALLISEIKKLDEPQKVKVPACVGELLDYYRKSTDVDLLALLICFKDWYFRNDKTSENEEAIDWLVKHPEKFMKAWLGGYEVEEEPKYRVNIGGLYLKEPLADTNDFTISMTWNKDYAYPFDSWNMAREHTSELGGTVEKV